MQLLWIPEQLPSLNEMIEARIQSARAHNGQGKRWNAYSDMKRTYQERIAFHAFSQKFRHVQAGHFSYLCKVPDRRKDPSNVLAGAMKLIEDALQECKLLAGDGFAHVLGIAGHPALDKKQPGTLLVVRDDRVMLRDEILGLDAFR